MAETPWKERELVIGSDHGGFGLKLTLIAHLIQHGIPIEDVGCHTDKEPVDYPDIAKRVTERVLRGKRGILLCGTGLGMCIAANKVRGVRAALCYDEHTARMSREHNDANVLCLGGRVLAAESAITILDTWLSTAFSGEERHSRRVQKISALEAEE